MVRTGAADCDDVVQEVFTLAWRRIGDLRDPGRFRSWLLQIARRAVIEHGRRHRCRPGLDRDDERVLHAVTDHGALSRRDALVIAMVADLGFDLADVADALDITSNNAVVVLHRARRRLRATLAECPAPVPADHPAVRCA